MTVHANVNQVGLTVGVLAVVHLDAELALDTRTESVHNVTLAILVMHVTDIVPIHAKAGQQQGYQLVIKILGVVTLVVIPVIMVCFAMNRVVVTVIV